MNSPLHLVGLVSSVPASREESGRTPARTDVQWGTPVFRAPVLPSPHQIYAELPFTANLRPRVRPRT